MRTRHRPENGYEDYEYRPRGGGAAEQSNSVVSLRLTFGHNAGADNGRKQEGCTDNLGRKSPRERHFPHAPR